MMYADPWDETDRLEAEMEADLLLRQDKEEEGSTMNIEWTLEKLLIKAGLDSKVRRLEASSHLAWGIVFPWLGGPIWLVIWLVFFTFGPELVRDGHLERIVRRTETRTQFVDFLWDLGTRGAGSLAYVWLR